ncbi:MAG: MFS transporter [Peptococcaceae bacterium]|nr:MFS transporter [Peptococcaceae bacterium]
MEQKEKSSKGGNDLSGENSHHLHTKKKQTKWRALLIANLAHFIHDGFTDMLYVFFPIWQSQWALSFGEVGLLKTLVSGSMALFQLPSGNIANRLGPIKLLVIGTSITSLAVLLFGWVTTPFLLGCLIIIGGTGSSVQHPLSSSIVSDAFSDIKARRSALSALNFIGDIGKLALPAAAAFLISAFHWQSACRLLALFGLIIVLILAFLASGIDLPDSNFPHGGNKPVKMKLLLGWNGYQAFWALSIIGIIDGATRMAFLTFFPFLLYEKGAGVTMVGIALTLVFAGGATGKLACGVLATRVGILRSVILTESFTAICVLGMIFLPLPGAFLLAPILGIALNGTSSVLYGSVPELVSEKERSQAFSIFYTAVLGSGAIAPFIYGLLSDLAGLKSTVMIIAFMVLLAIPLTVPLRGKFE